MGYTDKICIVYQPRKRGRGEEKRRDGKRENGRKRERESEREKRVNLISQKRKRGGKVDRWDRRPRTGTRNGEEILDI